MPFVGVQLPATGGGGVWGFGFALACAVLDSASAISAVISSFFIMFLGLVKIVLASCRFFLTPAHCLAMGRDRVIVTVQY